MGKLISIDGLDGSGKHTQSVMLYEYLRGKGENVKLVSFPNYESDSSTLVKMYLNGEISSNLYDINAYTASLFYACDRYVTWKKDLEDFYNKGGIIICDRYLSSNILHQTVKIADIHDRRKFADWDYDIETRKMGIPKEDKTIILLVKPEISAKLLTARYKGDDTKKDLHEGNIEYLQQCYSNAKEMAQFCGWSVVNCMTDDETDILSKDVIFNKILEELEV